MENESTLQTPSSDGTRKELLAKDLVKFIEHAWHVVEPSTPYVHGTHIQLVADHLEAVTKGQIRNLLINLPPRHMKSLTVSVFWPVWEWIAAPHRRWLFASYAASLSIRDSLKCRRLIGSPWFQERWGDRLKLTSDQNEKMRFENDKTGCRIATSVGGSATGEGGDRVVVDDPHNVSERESDSIRRATLTWWDETMSTRLNDPKTGAKVIVMQRIHEKDLSGHVLEQGGYVHLCLPAEFDPAHRCTTILNLKDERMVEGELLWPERISRSEIADFKLRLGPAGYAGQFQQRPAPAGGNRFKQEWFRYYRTAQPGSLSYPLSLREKGADWATARDRAGVRGNDECVTQSESSAASPHPNPLPRGEGARGERADYILARPDGSELCIRPDQCSRFAVMDPAGTEPDQNTRPCYTVIQVWDVTPAHDMLLVHQYRAQVQAPDAAAAAVRIAREFDVGFLAIEKDGHGLGIVQTVKRAGIAVKPIKARGSKEARSETAEIRMAGGMIYFPQGAPFLWDLEQELIHFPRGEYADQVDALAHAAMQVQRMSGGLVAPKEPIHPETLPVDDELNDDDWI
jgi:predicted phage terminase large subunit-like protein